MYHLFKKTNPNLFSSPDRLKIIDAMVANNDHDICEILMENEDHAELLIDAFLTPTLLILAESGTSDMFSVWKEFGYGFNTVLIDPNDNEPSLTLGQWAACALNEQRLDELQEMNVKFIPWSGQQVPSSPHISLSPASYGILQGSPEISSYWINQTINQLQIQADKPNALFYKNPGSVKRELSVLLDGLTGIEKIDSTITERFNGFLDNVQSLLWSVNSTSGGIKELIESNAFQNNQTLKRIVQYFTQKSPFILEKIEIDPRWKTNDLLVLFSCGLELNTKNLACVLRWGLSHKGKGFKDVWKELEKVQNFKNLIFTLPNSLKQNKIEENLIFIFKNASSLEQKNLEQAIDLFESTPLSLKPKSKSYL